MINHIFFTSIILRLLYSQLFVVRNKGNHNSNQVVLYGRPEDIQTASSFVKKVLPRINLTSEVVPITKLQSDYLRCPHGVSEVLSPFENQVQLLSSNS